MAMVGRSRWGQMVLGWNLRKATRERPFRPEEGLRLYKSSSMRSFLDTRVNRERGRGGGRSSEFQTGSLDKVQSWLSSVGVKIAESSVKGHQIRRPFHQDHYLLRKAAETRPRGETRND